MRDDCVLKKHLNFSKKKVWNLFSAALWRLFEIGGKAKQVYEAPIERNGSQVYGWYIPDEWSGKQWSSKFQTNQFEHVAHPQGFWVQILSASDLTRTENMFFPNSIFPERFPH